MTVVLFVARPSGAGHARLFALISSLLLASACLAGVTPWNTDAQGQFITSPCPDAAGHTWIGTEHQA